MRCPARALVLSLQLVSCSSDESLQQAQNDSAQGIPSEASSDAQADSPSLEEAEWAAAAGRETDLDATDNDDASQHHTSQRHTIADGPITIEGRKLLAGGSAFHIRGVCWNSVPKGASYPDGLDFSGAAEVDIPLMQAAGINAVRTYELILDIAVLDALYRAGIKVIMSFYAWGGAEPKEALKAVNAVKIMKVGMANSPRVWAN